MYMYIFIKSSSRFSSANSEKTGMASSADTKFYTQKASFFPGHGKQGHLAQSL